MEIDLLLAVDCSTTNDHTSEEGAIYFSHGAFCNSYQSVIDKIGTIMESYSKRHYFKMW
jgi:hypothetical protein